VPFKGFTKDGVIVKDITVKERICNRDIELLAVSLCPNIPRKFISSPNLWWRAQFSLQPSVAASASKPVTQT